MSGREMLSEKGEAALPLQRELHCAALRQLQMETAFAVGRKVPQQQEQEQERPGRNPPATTPPPR